MIINLNPLVCFFDNFLTADECDHIINLAKPQLADASVCAADGSRVEHEGRTNEYAFIPHDQDPTINYVCSKVARFANLPLYTAESMQVIYYDQNEEYKPHHDGWELTETNWLGSSGNRIMTGLIYLNDVEAGGGTVFPELNIEVMPKKGRIVFFANTFLGNPHRHPQSLHGGAPVIRGEKWACNLWFREREYVGATKST